MAKYCDICDIELYTDGQYQSHLIGKRHLKNVEHKNFEKRMQEHSIYVSRIPQRISSNELIAFFQKYGPIAKYQIKKYYTIIEYNNREPVDYLLNNPISINKHRLKIEKRTLVNTPKKTNDNKSMREVDPISIDIIRDKFENEDTFDSQFAAFLDAIELKDTEIATSYNMVCEHLDNIFSSIFPNCHTYRFGSTLTGLGFKQCDLDIYMDIGAPIYTLNDEQQSGTANKQLHTLWTMKKIFSRVKSIMYRMSNVFTDIRPILKTKTPIIKFCYVPTNISCDISFKNNFAIYNSLLIKHCLSHDLRIRPLMMLIKYWARQCQLTKCGLISNYALILMVIFYLQQPEQDILPPLMEFQKTSKPKFIDGWQMNSEQNVMLPKSSNNSSIPELLQGFFEFYINFDFKENVISPLDGIIHKKQEFNDTESLPSYMTRYKEMVISENVKLCIDAPICIQDPIELNRNCAACIFERLLNLFKAFCETGANVCKSSRKDNYKNLLIPLLEPIPQVNKNQEFFVTIILDHYLNVGLPDNSDKRKDITNKDQYKKDKLFFTVFNVIRDIFEKVFKFEIEVLSNENGTKQQKIEVISDVHTKEHQQLLLICKGSISVWFKRKSNAILLDPSISALEGEAFISNIAAEKYIQNGNPQNCKLNFTCKFEKSENPLCVRLTFTKTCKKSKVFNKFKEIAQKKIPEITIKTLTHMIQYKKNG